jgi:ribonuclease D
MKLDLPPPTIVAEGRALEGLMAELEREREIAVDTEADSFFNFREKVCLLQITAGERDWLVDPLAGLDLRPLGRVFADPARTKIFHDGEYDILILKRDWGFEFKNLFDTRVAAAALGIESPGLGAVLKARFGIELDKSLQRSNWSARPLTHEQISYARLDTHFLVPLAREQRVELAARGRALIVEGECRRLEGLVPSEQVFSPDDFIRLKGARALDAAAQSRLRELFALRYELARDSDLPPFKVLGNDALLALAEADPKSARDLAHVPGFSPKQARRHGDALLAALERARQAGPLTRPPTSQPRDGTHALSEQEFELHERLKDWRKMRAQREGYDSSLVLNRHVMLRLAQQKPTTREALARVEGMQAWQLEAFGDELLEVIRRGLAELPERSQARGHRRPFRPRHA